LWINGVESLALGKEPLESRPSGPMQAGQFPVEGVMNEVDGNSLALEESKTIVAVDVILRIYAVHGDRIIALLHLPHYRSDVVYVVKVANKKKIHD
jgi:hypothetical protein